MQAINGFYFHYLALVCYLAFFGFGFFADFFLPVGFLPKGFLPAGLLDGFLEALCGFNSFSSTVPSDFLIRTRGTASVSMTGVILSLFSGDEANSKSIFLSSKLTPTTLTHKLSPRR